MSYRCTRVSATLGYSNKTNARSAKICNAAWVPAPWLARQQDPRPRCLRQAPAPAARSRPPRLRDVAPEIRAGPCAASSGCCCSLSTPPGSLGGGVWPAGEDAGGGCEQPDLALVEHVEGFTILFVAVQALPLARFSA